jgi:hypothetical protein
VEYVLVVDEFELVEGLAVHVGVRTSGAELLAHVFELFYLAHSNLHMPFLVLYLRLDLFDLKTKHGRSTRLR